MALHPFVEAHIDEEWERDLEGLQRPDRRADGRPVAALAGVRRSGQVPKLGAVQRWVRDCMNEDEFAALGTKDSVRTLDAIIRLQPVRWWWDDGAERDQPRGAQTGQLAPVIRCSGDPDPQDGAFQATPREVPVPTDPERSPLASTARATARGSTGAGSAPVLGRRCAGLWHQNFPNSPTGSCTRRRRRTGPRPTGTTSEFTSSRKEPFPRTRARRAPRGGLRSPAFLAPLCCSAC